MNIRRVEQTYAALYGFCFVLLALVLYVFGALMGPVRLMAGNPEWLKQINEWVVWYSGIPLVVGVLLILYDLLANVRHKRFEKSIRQDGILREKVTVALTAYNDELSIQQATRDFLAHPNVERVIVISNNSTDNTYALASQAGAIVFNESLQGYGACVHRALTEACRYEDTDLIVLCEGDCTFVASDIDKFLAYTPHADIVNGTRIVEKLQDNHTQLSMFMHYGNLFVGKLLEMKYLGEVTLTDVGTTYKVCRREALTQLLPQLSPVVNLEFNPYFLDKAIFNGFSVLECPITFHPRIGQSKGGNINNTVALKLGVSMIVGILSNWKGKKFNG